MEIRKALTILEAPGHKEVGSVTVTFHDGRKPLHKDGFISLGHLWQFAQEWFYEEGVADVKVSRPVVDQQVQDVPAYGTIEVGTRVCYSQNYLNNNSSRDQRQLRARRGRVVKIQYSDADGKRTKFRDPNGQTFAQVHWDDLKPGETAAVNILNISRASD